MVLLVFFRLKKITSASADTKDGQQDMEKKEKGLVIKSQQDREVKNQVPLIQKKDQIKKKNPSSTNSTSHKREEIKDYNENNQGYKKGTFYQSKNRKKGKD